VEEWYDVARRQAGMLSQRQLTALGVSRSFVRNQIRAERWLQPTSSVFSTTTGPLARPQLLWRAVLHAGPTALVGGLTAAEVHGLQRWHRDRITVIVDDELSFDPLDGVRFFRSRRPLASFRSPGALPVCLLERCDSALRSVRAAPAYGPWRRGGHGAATPDDP
jgi:hypothetical protein